MAQNTPAQAASPDQDVITVEELEKMSPAQQRQVAHTLKETAIFLSQVTEEDLKKIQAMPWEKLQQPADPNRPLTDEDREAYKKLLQLIQEGKVTMAQVLGYSEAELTKTFQTGVGLANQGRFEDAIKIADGLLFLVPNLAGAHILKGEALRKMGKVEEALEQYNLAIAAEPTRIEGYWERAKLLFAVQNVPGFLMDIESVASLDPEAKTIFGKRARTLLDAAENELLSQGFTAEQIEQAEEQILDSMLTKPAEERPEINDDGMQIRKK
jgi:tetratricopeptide (TPR) repeat protein